jgi:DNA-damage-inducible protein D
MNQIAIGAASQAFEGRKKSKEGIEYWSAREIYPLLGYETWEKFSELMARARKACENSGEQVENHFRGAVKMVAIGSGARREVSDFELTRFACYLIALNGDPRKKEIANAQAYFAVQTRKQEILDELSEDEKRLFIRNQVKEGNKKLFETAKKAGVKFFGRFNDAGYMGLYGGLTAKQIEGKKRIPKGRILDRAGSTELAANLFRITQADEKLVKEKVKGQKKSEGTHYFVGKKVRDTIEDIGGTRPEELPVEEDIKGIGKKNKFPKL